MASASIAAVFSYDNLVHALAGASGSVTAMTVFFPLDTARLRLQVDEKRKSRSTPTILKEIVREEGLQAVYRGWFPVISSLCCSNFVYFYTFNSLKTLWLDQRNNSSPGKDMLMGFLSGAVNVLLTTPMWVVNTRLKLQGAKFRNERIEQTNYKGMFDAFRQIIEKEGVRALWNGTLPSLVLAFNPAIQFMVYEGLKRQAASGKMKVIPRVRRGVRRFAAHAESFLTDLNCWTSCRTMRGATQRAVRQNREKLRSSDITRFTMRGVTYRHAHTRCPAWVTTADICNVVSDLKLPLWLQLNAMDIFIIGAIAKAIATTATFPLQTVQSILRFGQYESGSSSGVLGSLKNILLLISQRVRKQGVAGLYKGLEAKLLQTVLTAALMFVLYEKIAALTFRIMGLNSQATR